MLIGPTIGPFQIEKELGSGAMGTVYRAIFNKPSGDSVIRKHVAIKVIAPGLGDNEKIYARFEREANILKQLRHPNIVRLLATGKYHGSPFYAMEFVEGESLDKVLERRGRFTWEEVIEIGKQVSAALAHAHANGIIHRDLKPANLMVDKRGVIKLTDFGIAKDTDQSGLTSANSTVGTAAYMSPEQCRGERDLTAKSDIYSFGIVLYELLTGDKPFVADNAMDMFIQHVQGEFARPAKRLLDQGVVDVPPWLDTLICQCMEKKPDQRPADAATVGQAMEDIQRKVEARKSAGVAKAAETLRKSKDAGDKDAAEALIEGKRRKKKKKDRQAIPWPLIGAGTGLALLTILMLAAIIYAFMPVGSDELLKGGTALVEEAEAALERGDTTTAGAKFFDAKRKFLNKLANRAGDPLAVNAEALLKRSEAGTLYGRGRVQMEGDQPNWQKAKERGWEELLTRFPRDMKFVEKARQELAKYEAPFLADQGLGQAKPGNEKEWKAALNALGLLVTRYPEHPKAAEAKPVLAWLTIHDQALARVERKRNGGEPWQASSEVDLLVLEAVDVDLDDKADNRRAAWQKIVTWGNERIPDGKLRRELPQFLPYIQLAQIKLEGLRFGGGK
jgi:tRNA A-37 threonylcarbamoyl transferase component Bud32